MHAFDKRYITDMEYGPSICYCIVRIVLLNFFVSSAILETKIKTL